MIWLLVVGYFVMALVAIRVAYVRLDPEPEDDYDREDAYLIAVMLSLFWPLVAAMMGTVWLAMHTVFRETKRQKAARLQQGREQERVQALRQLEANAPEFLTQKDRETLRQARLSEGSSLGMKRGFSWLP